MKKHTEILLIFIMVLSLTACTDPNNIYTNTGNKDANSNSQANIVSTTNVTEPTPTPNEPDTIDLSNPDNTPDTITETVDSWKQIYADFLENDMDEITGYADDNWYEDWTFGFIYLNDDDIPELVLSTGYEAGGNIILTIVNGKVDYIRTARLGFYYDEYDNILINHDGHMGMYYDIVFSINEDGFELIKDGEFYELIDEELESPIGFEYYLDGEEVSVDEYLAVINSYIPQSEKKHWSSGSTYKSIMDYLTGKNYATYKEAYKSVAEDMLGEEKVHFALVDSDPTPYLILDNDDWTYVYYYQDGVAFRGESFYGFSSDNRLYPETGTTCYYYLSDDNVTEIFYIYTSDMGSTYFSYTSRHGEYDENGDYKKDKNGNYILTYSVNGDTVSKEEYEEYLKQFDGEEYIPLIPCSAPENDYYEYYTPEEMYDLLGK